jgi:hypothetical protein
LPNIGWPAPTLTESFSLWSIGFQPQPGQCLEKTSAGEDMLCADVHVLEILEGVDGCSGMTVKDTGSKTCQQVCEEDMRCSTWIVRSDGLCYTGLGTGCFSGDDATANAATAGARLLHGNYRVLAPMKTREVAGLTQIMTKTETEGLGPRAAAACKNMCLSSIECQYWQLRKAGCWIENEEGSINAATYPLLSSMLSDPAVNTEVIHGEYIQRFCTSANPSHERA